MSFASEYRQGKREALRFELLAYGLFGFIGCLVAATASIGVMAWNMQHGDPAATMTARAPAASRPAPVLMVAPAPMVPKAVAGATLSECRAAMRVQMAGGSGANAADGAADSEVVDLVCGFGEMRAAQFQEIRPGR